MKTVLLSALVLTTGLVAKGQNPTVIVNTPTTTNVYASQEIRLETGFETTTDGFEAKIKLPEATAGRWSPLQLWTPFERTAGVTTGLIGIHTHVLPNGLVLTWEGHNDDAAATGVTQGHLRLRLDSEHQCVDLFLIRI